MQVYKEKDKVYGFLLDQLLGEAVLMREDNVGKFLVEYFRVGKISV